MKFFLTAEQSSYFHKHKNIDFEDVLTFAECEQLKHTADTLLAKRLNTTTENLPTQNTLDLYRAGRDLWHDDPKTRKFFLPAHLTQIALALFNQTSLRVGHTHYIRIGSDKKLPFTESVLVLQEISSLHKVVGAALIHEGKITFLDASYHFSPDILVEGSFLILFIMPKALYLPQPTDPLTHLLKRNGYVFGDSLQEAHFPLLRS